MNDPNGNVSTCNSTNLFFIKENKVLTSKGKYCLNGITRGKAIIFVIQIIFHCQKKILLLMILWIVMKLLLQELLLESFQSQKLKIEI